MTRSVSAGGNIERSVVVTGDGNSVSLSFGGSFVIPLDRRQVSRAKRQRSAQGYDPLPLLVPEADEFPLVGRETMLAELRAWLEEESDVSVRTLIARAGTGKTRLAVELCKAIDGAAKPGATGWVAGFVRPSDLAAFVEGLATRSFDWQRPTLLVFDYAAAVHRELARWFDRLASETFAGRLRLLLLDREAPEGFGWWHDLTRPTDNRRDTRRDLFVDPDRPQHLPDLEQGEERRALFEAALAAATRMIADKAPGHSLPAPSADPAFDAALESPRFGNPLNLAMAGLIAAERGPVAALALRRLDAARHFARHELGRMERIARGEGIAPLAMEHALGFNGLAGGLPLASLREDLAAELEAARLPAASAALADVLMQELPSPGSPSGEASEPRLGTIQPDLIGEGVIVEALLVGPADRALRAAVIVERAYSRTGTSAAEALMRLIQDYGHALEDPQASAAERDIARIVLSLLSALAGAIPDGEIGSLETLISAIPEYTTVLREVAAEQTRRLSDYWQSVAGSLDANDEDVETFARARAALWANNLSVRVGYLGQRELALTAAQDAVDIYRGLAAAAPASFTFRLAGALNNLSVRLAELGKIEDGLVAAEEGLDLFRALAVAHPEEFTRDVAGALNNLANCLSDLGQREAALAAAQEAVAIRRSLATDSTDILRADFAMSLSNLATRLHAVGQHDEALAAAREAVDLRRSLAAARPDSFTPDLALSLNNLVGFFSAVGQREAAVAAAQEAVALRRMLAATRPQAFAPVLATSLSNLAAGLSELGQREAALAAAQESVALRRSLAKDHPDAFMPDLSMSLHNLAAFLSNLGQHEAALIAAQEAVDIRRALAAARPDAFTAYLAGSLNNLAGHLSLLGRREEALAVAQEAVDLFRALAGARPDVFTPDFAMALSVLGDRLEDVERTADAVNADRQSVQVLSPYFLARPAVFAGPMMTYLRDYLRRAEAAEVEADMQLVGQIIDALREMEGKNDAVE